MENISHIGSLWTITDFRLDDGSLIRLKVGFELVITICNQRTFYKTHVYTKGYKCKNWVYNYETDNSIDNRILDKISEEQLYQAYYNHWQKMNPIRMFNNNTVNGELINFKVKENFQEKHFSF